MEDKITALKEKVVADLDEIRKNNSPDDARKAFYVLKMEYLGKTGALAELLKGMRTLSEQERPKYGKIVNVLRDWLEDLFKENEKILKENALHYRYQQEKIDVTMPANFRSTGNLHPISFIQKEIMDIFVAMGFALYNCNEIETDYYNFQALNIPKNHPARDMQDTFFIDSIRLLRSQTSTGQIHAMEEKKLPLKILTTGRVYRADSDATHSPIFHQLEGLIVDKNLSMCDLKGLLNIFAKKMFTAETKTRLRPSYFPFTEPSVEVDLSCFNCHGKGCKVCKKTGWIEVLGAGMVNRKVLQNCNIDANCYTGIAFGIGIERIAMIKYGIPDIRLFYENDIRFLRQFNKVKGE